MAKKLARFAAMGAAAMLGSTGLLVWWSHREPPPAPAPTVEGAGAARGGSLTATVRSEPRSFNRLVARDRTSNLVSLLLHDKLVRIDLATQQVEPALATSWEISGDGRQWTLHLRPDVSFSDGTPFSSEDVVFSFAAVYDARTASPLSGSLQVAGKPLEVSAFDPLTVVISLPEPFGPGPRLLDNLPILPKHKLAQALNAGTLRDVWGPATPPGELVGLGPFVLTGYQPGERLTFARNPRFWRHDDHGARLPYVDSLTLVVVPDQNAELLRLDAGEVDLVSGDVAPEDLAAITRAAQQGRLQLHDVGIGLDPDFLWFNLTGAGSTRPWLLRRELREAISLIVDRQGFADAVYLGAAVPIVGPVTPGNREWFDSTLHVPSPDLGRARRLLAGIGLADKDGDGQLEDADGTPARFALLTQKGNILRERSAAFVQQDLAGVGLGVDVVTLETPALIERVTTGRYEAAYFGTQASDTDPATNLDYWLSRGAFHPWNPAQTTPATPWEARIDELMEQLVGSADVAQRREAFSQVQRIFVDEMPAIYFAAPRVTVATGRRVRGVRAGLLQPYVLWDVATLSVSDP